MMEVYEPEEFISFARLAFGFHAHNRPCCSIRLLGIFPLWYFYVFNYSDIRDMAKS